MFDDKSKIPEAGAPEYHLMTIDPKSLAYDVYPIGNALPRFAMTRDGKGLLVDASVKLAKRMTASAKASASVSIGPDGVTAEAEASLTFFGAKAPFGYFEIETGKFTGFGGPQAGLDRFVQLADGKTVITLEKRTDGLGGLPFRIDLDAKVTAPLAGDYGTGVRDIGLLPDGVTLILRLRQPAAQIGTQLYSRESYCYSLDAETCAAGRVEYQATVAFASTQSNDCGALGHDCW